MRYSMLWLCLPGSSPCRRSWRAARRPRTTRRSTLGLAISQNLAGVRTQPLPNWNGEGRLSDGVQGKPAQVDLRTYGPKLQELQRSRGAAAAAQEKKTGESVIAKAAAEKGAVRLPRGCGDSREGRKPVPRPRERTR